MSIAVRIVGPVRISKAAFGAIAIAALTCAARANHGPGTSGGGSFTASGETLKRGQFDADIRFDYTQFESVSPAEAEARALQSGEFDALKWSMIWSASLTYGLTDDFQISGVLGYYYGWDFIDAESDNGITAESSTANPDGLTDLWLTAKYRILKGAPGNLALIGGVKFPTGRDDVRLDNGQELEPSSQPGTGAFDFQGGLAYSRFLSSRFTIDASGIYTARTEHDDFKVGDRLDLGVALAYRLTEDIKEYPNVSVFGEVLGLWLEKDHDQGVANPNSGGTTVYLSPGVRVRWNQNLALTIAPAFPVLQDLNGDQVKTRYKLGISLAITF